MRSIKSCFDEQQTTHKETQIHTWEAEATGWVNNRSDPPRPTRRTSQIARMTQHSAQDNDMHLGGGGRWAAIQPIRPSLAISAHLLLGQCALGRSRNKGAEKPTYAPERWRATGQTLICVQPSLARAVQLSSPELATKQGNPWYAPEGWRATGQKLSCVRPSLAISAHPSEEKRTWRRQRRRPEVKNVAQMLKVLPRCWKCCPDVENVA